MRTNKYKEFFTKDYLMGPNSIRLLDELLEKAPETIHGGRVLDLGCGMGVTSLFLARETAAEQVFATDLWISATTNARSIEAWGEEKKIIPIHADAMELPYAEEYFDAIVSIDAYHYFGCAENVFAEKILPLLKKGGYALLAMPGLKEEFNEQIPSLMNEWAGEDVKCFHSCEWWEEHIKQGVEDKVSVAVYESGRFDDIWNDWYQSGHEYAMQDKEFMDKGVDKMMNFVMLVVKKL